MRTLAAMIALLAGCGDNLAGPVAVDDYPAAVREALCRQAARCGEVESVEVCLAANVGLIIGFTASERAAIHAGKIFYDDAAAGACVDGIAGASCDLTSQTSRSSPEACQAIIAGALHDGEACTFGAECISQRCDVPDCGMACCAGRCAGETPPVRGGPGQSCATTPCAAGAFCDSATQVCTALRAAGAACRTPDECQYGLDCAGGTCAAPPVLGQPCAFACRDQGTTCSSVTHTCVAVGLVGAACTIAANPSDCSPLYVCDRTGHCSEGIAPGQPCGIGDRCAGDRAFCNVPVGESSGTCALPGPDGSPCARNRACDSLYCDPFANRCAPEPVCI